MPSRFPCSAPRSHLSIQGEVMAHAPSRVANKPAWVDLGSKDAAASRDFYAKLFGWDVEVNSDPQYGGYAIAKAGGHDAAGIGPTMSPGQPTTWSFYIG